MFSSNPEGLFVLKAFTFSHAVALQVDGIRVMHDTVIYGVGYRGFTKAKAILELYDLVKKQIVELTHSQYAIDVLDFIFRYPIFSASNLVQLSGIPRASSIRIINVLQENGLLKTVRKGRGRRSSIYVFERLLLVAEGTVPLASHQ